MMITVVLQNASQSNNKVPRLNKFQQWTDTVLQHITQAPSQQITEVCIRVVEPTESEALNQQYRHKMGPTNVLAFPNDPDPYGPALEESLGDIVICASLLQQEAQALELPLEHHWAHLTIHGILHLLGYNHVEKNDAIVMESLEAEILASLGIENPYQECRNDNSDID